MTPERIIEIRDEHLPSQGEAFDCLAFGLAIAREERHAALTEAAAVGYDAVPERLPHASSAVREAILDLRDQPKE